MEKGEASNWTKRKFRDAVEAITHGVCLSTVLRHWQPTGESTKAENFLHTVTSVTEKPQVFNACTQINTSALAPRRFVISQSWWSLVSLSHWVPLSVVLLDYKTLITITGSEKICFYPRNVCLFYLVIQRNTCHPCSNTMTRPVPVWCCMWLPCCLRRLLCPRGRAILEAVPRSSCSDGCVRSGPPDQGIHSETFHYLQDN